MMPRILKVAFVVALALACCRVTAQAQGEENSPEAANASKPYMPPSAPKSVEIGNFYLKRKKMNAALSRFQEAVKTDPSYAPGYLGLGEVYEKIGLKQKALEAYLRYLDTLPSTKQAEEAKEVHKAIARLERGLKKGKNEARRSSSRAASTTEAR